MRAAIQTQTKPTATFPSAGKGVLQRQCACGGTLGPTGECAQCRRQRKLGQPTPLQPKLTINQPGDRYEQEADRIAERVMRMPEPRVQRTCAACEEESLQAKPVLQRQIEPEEEEMLQTKLAGPRPAAANGGATAPPVVHEVLRSPGQPLDASTRAFMEPRFGHDFSRVRVYTDSRASASARAVRARAYTVGRNVVFEAGQYSPQTASGKRLLAHELTHTVQQQGGKARQSGLSQRKLGSPISPGHISTQPLRVQRLTNPLSDMSTFQSPGGSGWRGAEWGCYRNSCTKKHKGWDLHSSSGTECKAVVAGTTSHHSNPGGYGKYVLLTSTANATKKYIYGHLDSRESAGTVAEGAKVGKTGTGANAGNVSASRPHLHFTLKESESKVDPDGKGFTKPTKVIEATGSTATTFNESDPDPCTPCSM